MEAASKDGSANRIGIFLSSPGGIANVFVSGSEYYANIDPRVDVDRLRTGCRVLINEAYAVVGDLGYSPTGPVAKVGDVLEGGRLRLSQAHGTQEIVLERGAELQDVDLKVGDEVRVDPAFKVALERLQSAESKEYFIDDVPPTPWESIGGQHEAIHAIRDTIELPALHPELFERFQYTTPKGLPTAPAAGKPAGVANLITRAAHAAEEGSSEEHFMHIKGPEILNMWLGETERMVREVFAQPERSARGVFTLRIYR